MTAGNTARLALIVGALTFIAPASALATAGDWECAAGMCTAQSPTPITQLSGTFDHGANLSPSSKVDQLAALEQQRWREFRFVAAHPAQVFATATIDPDYRPANWPADIALGDVRVEVSRHVSLDGETYEKVGDGYVLPEGAYLSIIVEQETRSDDDKATYFPARWTVDVSTRRVIEEAKLGGDDPMLPSLVSDEDVLSRAVRVEEAIELDTAIDAALGCDGAECREPLDLPSAFHDDGSPVQGDPADPDAVDVAANHDATLDVDPATGDCGQGMLECAPEPDPEPVADVPAADPLAAELQTELARVGCYEAAIDGLWGPASRRAMTNFNHWAGKDAPVNTPTPKALVTVARTVGPVCGVD